MEYRKLRELLTRLKRKIPFYKDKISLGNLHKDEDLEKAFLDLPIIDKQTINRQFLSFLNIDLTEGSEERILRIRDEKLDFFKEERIHFENFGYVFFEKTTGTTGIPFITIKSLQDRIKLGHRLWFHRRSITPGLQHDDIYYHIHDDPRANYAFVNIDGEDERIKHEFLHIKKCNYRWVHTNMFALQKYIRYLQNNKSTVFIPQLEVIENSGYHLSNSDRRLLKYLFDCQVVNNYGCREIWTIAYDCLNGNLHVDENRVILELFTDGEQRINETETMGNIVITGLIQQTMPIVRYRIGDLGCFISDNCTCGKMATRLKLSEGRAIHKIKGTDLFGNSVFATVIKMLSCAKKLVRYDSIKFEQTKLKEFNVYIYMCGEDRKYLEQSILQLCKEHLNEDFSYTFFYIDKECNRSPKNDIFISKCD